jgi:hypothetical protein
LLRSCFRCLSPGNYPRRILGSFLITSNGVRKTRQNCFSNMTMIHREQAEIRGSVVERNSNCCQVRWNEARLSNVDVGTSLQELFEHGVDSRSSVSAAFLRQILLCFPRLLWQRDTTPFFGPSDQNWIEGSGAEEPEVARCWGSLPWLVFEQLLN